MNISVYSPLSGSTHINLSCMLKSSKEGLVNIKSSDNKCFLWCHIRHLNPLKIHPERVTKADKEMINDVDYEGTEFAVSRKDFSKTEKKNNICIIAFCYENMLTYPLYLSDQKFKNFMNLLMISDENKSHYVYIKAFNIFMFNKTKCKNKKHFCRNCLQCFSSERVLIKYREVCLKINGKQSANLKSGSIKFKNYFKQLVVPFKIYADLNAS